MKKTFLFVLVALICNVSFAQTKVTGKVTSAEDGTPIPFANVVLKGTMKGVTSNDIGEYTFENLPKDAVLIFSSIGFTDLEVPVNGRAVIDAVMNPDSQALDEVMVVAYGTAKKGTYTGAASVLKQESLKDLPTTSFEGALNGKIAGLQMSQSSGQAGSTSSIRIRGIGSMNAGNEPLYVIDGVPAISGDIGQMSDYTYSTNNVMNTINPADIESITILKDAAASALYGSRAANGVILVNTKKGKTGKPTISFKASVGITPSWAVENYKVAGVQENVQMLYEVFYDYRISDGKGRTAEYANSDALNRLNNKFKRHGYYFETDGTGLYDKVHIKGMTDGVENREGKYFDWEDALFRTAVFQTYDLSASGGTEQTNYYSSISYTKDDGRIKINGYDRISGRINLNQKVGKYIEFATSVNGARTKKSGFNDTRNTGSNYYMQLCNLLWGLYWPTDYKTGDPYTTRYGSYAQNNVYYNDLWDNSSTTLRFSINETLTAHILPGLDFKTVFSYDNTDTKDHYYVSAKHFNASTIEGKKVASVSEMDTQVEKTVSSSTLNYNKSFNKHNIGLLVGFEAERNKTKFQRSSGENLSTSSLTTVSTAGVLDANGYSWGSSMVSILSRAEYNYDDKYYASASYRRDGSSKLSPDTRWGDFWSVAGSWRITNENFMKNQNIFSNLRLRASYGVNGTPPSSLNGWRALTNYTSKYMEQPGGGLSNVASNDLTWESSYTYNLALEFGLLDQRLYGTVEYFNRDSKDLLLDVPISTITGFSSTLRNVGEINNKGFEVELGGDIIRTKDIKWSASVNASFIKSKVTKLYKAEGDKKGQDIIWYDPTGGDDRCRFIYREGESMLSVYGREWAGVDPKNGKNVWYTNNDTKQFEYNGRNASYKHEDADLVIVGDLTPKVYGGINTDFSWKGISLGLNFTYRIGKLYDGAERDTEDDGYYWERVRSQYVWDNRWTTEGQETRVPKLDGFDPTDAMQTSNRHLHNGNFLRLKTVTLGYNLPKNLLSKAGIKSTRVYFSGSNLLTFAAWKNVDPEVNSYGTRGWETPFGKTYTFGVEFSF